MTEVPKQETILQRVQALMAKAESTEFEAEAEAFMAKAQKLMTAHSITEAMINSRRANAEMPDCKEIFIENPYWRSKGALLSAVARANRCKCLWYTPLQRIDVFGFKNDIEAVELLFTSLLIQAVAGLQRTSNLPGSRTKSFRKSYLDGFAARIRSRLSEVDEAVIAEASNENSDLLPALVSREQAIEEAIRKVAPFAGSLRLSGPSNFAGYGAGVSAANAADLGGSRLTA